MTGQIAIIGLGQIGGSVGMALKEAHSSLRRVGFDKDAGVLNAAQSLEVIDQAARRLPDAVRDADIVLLALPLAEIPQITKQMLGHLKDSTVVMDTAPVKTTTAVQMAELLAPKGCYYVGLVPSITAEALLSTEFGFKAARPDLFRRTVMVIDVPRGMPSEVEQLAVNFAKLLGAKPMLADLTESDGFMSSTHILPQLAAAALLTATVDQPGWSDARKVAGRPFVGVTGGMAYFDDPASVKAAALANPTAVVHALDVLIASLTGLREDIQQRDEGSLDERLKQAFEARERWLNERGAAQWLSEGGESADLPHAGEQMMQMLFGESMFRRMKGKKDDGKKS